VGGFPRHLKELSALPAGEDGSETGPSSGEDQQAAGSEVYQLKTGHCLIGQYLKWARTRSTATFWWYEYRAQRREHFFKKCTQWKYQQKILWAAVRKEAGRSKDRFKIRDLFADKRCSQAILEFLATTDVGRRAPAPTGEDTQSEVSEGRSGNGKRRRRRDRRREIYSREAMW
jgi:hypothetical protein